MGDLSIKIRIADREYPMRVQSEDQEKIRLAGKLLNEKLREFQEQFGVEDKQDLIAMVAFDCFVEKLTSGEESSQSLKIIFQKLSDMDDLISTALTE
jgi:cell division protein ZapA